MIGLPIKEIWDEWWSKPIHTGFERPRNEREYKEQAFLSGVVPGLSGYYNYRDSAAYMDDYLRNRGLTYADIKYPSRTPAWSGYASLGSAMTLSKNVLDLYK